MSSCGTTARRVKGALTGSANAARCALGAASVSLERALRPTPLQVPPELSVSEPLGTLRRRFQGSSRVCSLDALRTVGVPDEILALACTGVDPIMAGTQFCDCGGNCAVDVGFLEDPDNRPYIWDQEEACL